MWLFPGPKSSIRQEPSLHIKVCSLILDCVSGIVPFVGDTFCDDENNNSECDYDGGDCCGGQLTFCSVCWCVIANMTNPSDFTVNC